MRFERHLHQTLNEKVSRDEIEQSLNNPNITVGMELEFKIDVMQDYIDPTILNRYNNAYSDWQDYNSECHEYDKDKDRVLREIDRIKEKIDKREKEYESLDDTLGDDESKNKSIVAKMDKVQLIIDELNLQLTEKNDELNDLVIPTPSNELVAYMEKFGDLKKGWENTLGNKKSFREPTDPRSTDKYSTRNRDEWMTAVTNLDKEGLWKSMPIPSYRIGFESKDYSTWNIVFDGSVEAGVELVSPPLSMPIFLEVMPKVFKWIDKHGNTDNDTGLHVHMGIQGINNLNGELDPIKMILLVDEEYIWKFFDERKTNFYARSMKPALQTRGISVDEIRELIDTQRLKKDIEESHYDSINFESWEKGHVEFRHMGGTNYHRKWNEIRVIVAKNAHALSAGCDPDYKRQEYLTKVARLANKFDLVRWSYVLEEMKPFIQKSSLLEKYAKMEYTKIQNIIGNTDLEDIRTNISTKMSATFEESAIDYVSTMLEKFKTKFPDYGFEEKEVHLLRRYEK